MRSAALLLALATAGSAAGAQATWMVAVKPILDVPGVSANGAVNFENPRGATRLSDGGLLVADRGSTSMRVFDAAGHLTKSVGREGKGPGEFGYIAQAAPCGRDSLLVWEPAYASIIGPTGAIARRLQLPSNAPGPQPALGFSCTASSISYV